MGVINERIHERRVSLGLTLLEVADYIGVKEATAQRYESGAIKTIGHETIVKLAEILKCDPSYLMGWSSSVAPVLSDSECELLSKFRRLNANGRRKLTERADELLDLGYVQKEDAQKMA